MKRVYLFFLMLTVFLNCSLVKPVVMPDQNLAAAVRAELGLNPNEPIFQKDLRELEFLIARHRGIKNLTGLEKAKNLQLIATKLWISHPSLKWRNSRTCRSITAKLQTSRRLLK